MQVRNKGGIHGCLHKQTVESSCRSEDWGAMRGFLKASFLVYLRTRSLMNIPLAIVTLNYV